MASAKSLFDALLPGLGVVSLLSYVARRARPCSSRSGKSGAAPSVNLSVAFAMTTLVAVLIDPHLVDYDLTVLVAAGIVAGVLVKRYALVILPLYVVTLLRAQIPFGDATIQLTAPLLAVLTVWMFWETRSPIASESVAESTTAPLLVTAVNSLVGLPSN